MRRALLTCIVVAGAAAASATVAAGAAQPPRASLERAICHRASNSLNRLVAITAVMRPLPGTERMELKFSLLEKARGDRSYSRVTGGDLGRWISPANRTLGQRPEDVWKLQKQVVNLPGPAIYRFHVGFRWSGAHGHPLGRRYEWAPPCDQP